MLEYIPLDGDVERQLSSNAPAFNAPQPEPQRESARRSISAPSSAPPHFISSFSHLTSFNSSFFRTCMLTPACEASREAASTRCYFN